MHTSASLALNESWDPDVRDDMEMMLNKIVPEGLPYRHSCEGPDDMVRLLIVMLITYPWCRFVLCFVFDMNLITEYDKAVFMSSLNLER